MEELLKLVESLDYNTLKYAEIMQVVRKIEEKISMYDSASKKLKEQRDAIKEIVRLRMIEEELPSCDTDLGRLKPTSKDCLTMANLELFLDWLRDGFIEDISQAADAVDLKAVRTAVVEYRLSSKPNDRLSYLTQSCFNKQKLKAMYEDPEDTLPPGIGVFEKHDLSITKPPKPKKGAKNTK